MKKKLLGKYFEEKSKIKNYILREKKYIIRLFKNKNTFDFTFTLIHDNQTNVLYADYGMTFKNMGYIKYLKQTRKVKSFEKFINYLNVDGLVPIYKTIKNKIDKFIKDINLKENKIIGIKGKIKK